MGESHRIRAGEIRAVFRLVGECAELGADPYAWRERWFEGASELVGAVAAIGGEVEGFFHEPQYRILQMICTGLDAAARRLHQRYMREEGHRTIDVPLEGWMQAHRSLTTRSHEQLIGRDKWERSVLFNEFFRPCRIDDRLLSGSRFPPVEKGGLRLYNTMTMYRGLGDRPFSARDRRLMQYLHRELRPLVGKKLATCQGQEVRPLSPRLRQTLDLLLRGQSEQKMAEQLGVAPSTLHEYIGRIYRRYGVRSRRELMARFLQWRGEDRL